MSGAAGDEQPRLFAGKGGAVRLEAKDGMHEMTILAVDGAVELTIGRRTLRLTYGRAAALSAALGMAIAEIREGSR